MRYRYRSDEELKDSGVEWIGKIPKDWEVIRIKHLSPIGRGASPRPIDDERYFDDNGEYGWTRISDVSTSGKYLLETQQRMSKLGSSYSVKLEPNSLFISIAGTVGKPCISKIKACIHDGFIYFHCLKEEYVDYLYNIFSTGKCYAGLGKLGTQLNLNRETIGNIYIPDPNREIKNKVCKFIEEKTSQFDLIISKKEKLIERLEEAKKSLISEVVTGKVKVVKTDGGYELVKRSSEEMKDSGVEWVKEIPIHWEVINGKWLFNQRKDKARIGDEQLTASQKHGVIFQKDFMQLENQKVVLVEKDFRILKHVEPNDFVISMRSFQGGLEYSQLRGCISSAYVMLTPNENVYSPFFRWFFKSAKYINALQSTSNLVRDGQAMRYSNFTQIPLFIFSIEEQVELADYLDKSIYNIDNLILKTQNQIEKLKEAKQSLISEAVTGKIEVL